MTAHIQKGFPSSVNSSPLPRMSSLFSRSGGPPFQGRSSRSPPPFFPKPCAMTTLFTKVWLSPLVNGPFLGQRIASFSSSFSFSFPDSPPPLRVRLWTFLRAVRVFSPLCPFFPFMQCNFLSSISPLLWRGEFLVSLFAQISGFAFSFPFEKGSFTQVPQLSPQIHSDSPSLRCYPFSKRVSGDRLVVVFRRTFPTLVLPVFFSVRRLKTKNLPSPRNTSSVGLFRFFPLFTPFLVSILA